MADVSEVRLPDGTLYNIAGGGGGGSVPPATVAPLMDGVAAVGTAIKYAREDHVHPSDTSKANVNSPTLTGTPQAPTAAAGTSTDQIATTQFVQNAVSGAAVSPATANPLMDGTADVGSSVKYAREDHVHPSDTTKADLASPSFTGTPTAPTPSAGTDNTQIATTEFVNDAVDAAKLKWVEDYTSTDHNVVMNDVANNDASGDYSTAGGEGTIAAGDAQTAIGKYNVSNNDHLFIIGKGTSDTARDDAFVVTENGRVRFGDYVYGYPENYIEIGNGTSDSDRKAIFSVNENSYLHLNSDGLGNRPYLYFRNRSVSNKAGETIPPSSTYPIGSFAIYDSDNNITAYIEAQKDASDSVYLSNVVRRRNSSGTVYGHGFYQHLSAEGTPSVTFYNTASRNAWLSALGAATATQTMGSPSSVSGGATGLTLSANTSCKTGNQVSINIRYTGATMAAGTVNICTLPAGFRPAAQAFCVLLVNGVYRNGAISTAGVITVYSGVAVSNVEIKIMSTFRTS